LGDILFVNKNPFFFRVHSPSDPEKKKPDVNHFSTEGSLNIFMLDFNLFTIAHPAAVDYKD
jgi:hypothetical protein